MQRLLEKFPDDLSEAVRIYEESLLQPKIRKTIWQTWREPRLSGVLESKWEHVLISNPTFERHVVTNLYDVFPKAFNDDGEYFNRTVGRIIPGAAKADVWRYSTLYHYGGIYVDADSMIVDVSLEAWLSLAQANSGPAVPILSNEGHWWKRQYLSRCKGIWEAANLTLPETYGRSVLQWMLVFPYPRHPILWQALRLIDKLIGAAAHWEEQARLADKVLCVTGPVVFTVSAHMVLESYPQLKVRWEGIDYNGKGLFKDPAAPKDELHYQIHPGLTSEFMQSKTSAAP